MYSAYIPEEHVFTGYASMYAVNATIKISPILTKVVIPLAFSKISPEARTETAKTLYSQK